MSRFSQAISEGDGISVIPLLEGDVAVLASLAEAAGAEAVAVAGTDVERARKGTNLPIITREGDPQALSEAGADACIVVFAGLAQSDDRLESIYTLARDLDLDCAVDVRDEEQLEQVLERIDPEILLLSEREIDRDEEDLELTLDLLADVPAGKLVISEAKVVSRAQVVALERAGVDAVLVRGLARPGSDFSAVLQELVRGSGPHR
jgi:indole-3-glycerol phosphate synthase